MGFSEINAHVSIHHWQKILEKEKSHVNNTAEGLYWKAAICGLLAGDGSVQERHMSTGIHREVRLFADDIEMEKIYIYALKKVYHKTPWVSVRDNVTHIRLTSKTVVQDLMRLALFGTYDWHIPFSLVNSYARKVAWVKGFFSGEAYVGPSHIKVQTVNEKGMKELSKLLDEIGIRHKMYKYNPRRKNHKEVHILRIQRKKEIKKYHDTIGFWHARKTQKLKKTLSL